MKRILTPSEMRFLDRKTWEENGFDSFELMKRAGSVLFSCLNEQYSLNNNSKIVAIAGSGNNGGDAVILASLLLKKGYQVKIMKVFETKVSSECEKAFSLVNPELIIPFNPEIFHETDVIIDGMFGIGLNRPVTGPAREVIENINQSGAFVFSVDIPSGINGENGRAEGIAVKADCTGVIGCYKNGNFLNDAKDYHGKTVLLDIGIAEGERAAGYLLDEKNIRKFTKRRNNTHKYHYGSVLVFGGSPGMTGAPLLSGFAALKTGSGLSSLAIYEDYVNRLWNIYPELMVKTYRNIDDLPKLLEKKSAVAFGPGLGRNDSRNDEILSKLIESNLPLVIDADGLYYLKSLLPKLRDYNRIIITPHIGEMAMLLNLSNGNIENNPLKITVEFAKEYHLTVVLKGPCTVIADEQEIYFSPYGNPGMATAGSGDVLTGVISAFAGMGYNPMEAAKTGVLLHSFAGEEARNAFGEYSLTATDIIHFIPDIIKKLSTDESIDAGFRSI